MENREQFERQLAAEVLSTLRAGRVGKAAEKLAYEVSMGECEGEWIAFAVRAVARRGGLRRLLAETASNVWNDTCSGEVDATDLGFDDPTDREAWPLCLRRAALYVRDALDQWRYTHTEEYYAETPRGRRLRDRRTA